MHQNPPAFKTFLKRLYLSLKSSNKLIVLDYPVEPKPVYTLQKPHQKLYDFITKNRQGYVGLLTASKKYFPYLQLIKTASSEKDEILPTWNNGYLPGLDVLILYTVLNEFKPKQYIEIGSGTSTKIAYKARSENGLNFRIHSIDPFPRQEIKHIADEWQGKKIQEVSFEQFEALEENDIVFFDGTHMLLPYSDTSHFFLEILPRLQKGVIVQIHDIYLPYDYPQFMCDRYYSENYILGAVLLSNPDRYKIICPNFYISEEPQLAQIISTFWQHPNLEGVEKHGGSFWFQIQ